MAKVQVLFFPSTVDWFAIRKIEVMRQYREDYVQVAEFNVTETGEDAAEEAFDISNNPGRDDERVSLFGRMRSVSTGDIVVVDGVEYACMPCGWEKV